MKTHITLNGDWSLRWFDGQRGGQLSRLFLDSPDLQRALPAQVPGAVHLDLLRAGIIDEPSEGLNALKARWVEEAQWFYYRTFQAPPLEPGERAYLTFECLDLAAVIYLNGQEVGRHANAFYPCCLEVSQHLRAGQNSLVVAIESGLYASAEKPATGYGGAIDARLHKRHWLRQTQSTFGWDWAPRLLNVGIRGDVRLEICRHGHVEAYVVLAELSEDLQTGTVKARMFVEGLRQETQSGTLTIKLEETGESLTREVKVAPGMNILELQVEVPRPQLWWPVNHGAQPLYLVVATLAVGGEAHSATRKVGFRHIEVDQSPHPEGGRYFMFVVNGKPVFCKGGNFVPADSIFARLDRSHYETVVDRALEANFNFLRVWGGGLYESDDFYELCDEKGILVWQEFIFACSKYPTTDENFLADVRREATYQVRRLAHHPSLVAWCGNNELEWAAWDWHYDQGVAYPDYALYHLVIPRILKAEDGTRYYQPGSPFSPDLESPNQDQSGDQHPWTVGFANIDFRDYRKMICRFPNEGGILGPTALPTVLACLPNATRDTRPFAARQGDRRLGSRLSFAFESHDNGIASLFDRVYPDEMLVQWLGKSIQEMTVEEYVYYGGLVQGEGLVEYIRNFRRRMFSSSCAIFWMYNDCWPATRSWTVVDYYGRRTPAFYPVRRAFQPLMAAIAVEDDLVKVFCVNEGSIFKGELRCGLFALEGGYPLEIGREVTLPANTSTIISEFPLSKWLTCGERTHAAFATLSQNGREVARDRIFLPYFKEMVWPKAEVTVRCESGQAIFESQAFAWRVCLDLDGEASLPDNFFDVLPGIPTILDWPDGLGEPKILRIGNLIG